MTKDERLFKRALDVLDWAHDVFGLEEEGIATKTALRERLAQPEQCQYPNCKCATENPCLKGLAQPKREPVAWCQLTASEGIAYFDGKPMIMVGKVGNEIHPAPLYTTPPQGIYYTPPQRKPEQEMRDVLRLAQDALQMACAPFPVDEVKTMRALQAVTKLLKEMEQS